jgi:hypothetical protein
MPEPAAKSAAAKGPIASADADADADADAAAKPPPAQRPALSCVRRLMRAACVATAVALLAVAAALALKEVTALQATSIASVGLVSLVDDGAGAGSGAPSLTLKVEDIGLVYTSSLTTRLCDFTLEVSLGGGGGAGGGNASASTAGAVVFAGAPPSSCLSLTGPSAGAGAGLSAQLALPPPVLAALISAYSAASSGGAAAAAAQPLHVRLAGLAHVSVGGASAPTLLTRPLSFEGAADLAPAGRALAARVKDLVDAAMAHAALMDEWRVKQIPDMPK